MNTATVKSDLLYKCHLLLSCNTEIYCVSNHYCYQDLTKGLETMTKNMHMGVKIKNDLL